MTGEQVFGLQWLGAMAVCFWLVAYGPGTVRRLVAAFRAFLEVPPSTDARRMIDEHERGRRVAP